MSEITNPHDRFFKEVFSRPDVAEEVVLHFLPPTVSHALQPGTFRLREGSFVDAQLRQHYSDLLYQVDFKEGPEGYVYILFEHKSSPDPHIAWQILRYTMRIWEQEAKENTGSFPPMNPIIPIVLYHGTAKWRVPPNFASLYRGHQSPPTGCLDFTHSLVDLSVYSDFEIKLRTIPTVALLLMKHIYSDDLPQRLPGIFALLRALARETALDFIETLLRYTSAAAPERITVEHVRQAVEAALPERGGSCMNKLVEELIREYRPEFFQEVRTEAFRQAREEVREEAFRQAREEVREEALQQVREEVREEGMREGAAALAIRQLVRKVGNVDSATEERVHKLSLDELEKLGEALLDFPSTSVLIEWLDRIEASH